MGFLLGFLLGLLALAALEVAGVLLLVRYLRLRQAAADAAPPAGADELPGERPFPYEKQGFLWILEPEKLPKASNEHSLIGGPKETKDKKNIMEVFPAKKLAKIEGHSLTLSSPDGSQSQATIELLNCMVLAVSASSMPSRKWAKRYPIKLESKDCAIYNGSKLCYLYTDTSWEKESWCKALRIAATADKEKLNWHAKLSEEFLNYISSLNSEYPCFLKPPMLSGEEQEVMDRTVKTDGSSKVRLFLKKLAKKASTKAPLEGNKSTSGSSVQGEKKILDKLRSYQGAPFLEALMGPQEDKSGSSSLQDTVKASSPAAALSHPGQLSAVPEVNADDRAADEGTLCWNLLSSRLFFDAKMSDEINKAIKARIQRTLSNMRTPAYMGDIILADFSLGKLPPYVHTMRVLPLDLNELWAFEVDFEYSGGILLNIETRLEVQEPELQKDIMKTNFGEDSDGAVNSDLLESIEHYGNQFRDSQNSVHSAEEKDEADVLSQSKNTGWTSAYISRWKNILHSIADHVSQVPLSLAIRISSVRGVLRIHLKPPPSDQIWFGFTSMPDLEWELESSVGDRKISNSHIATLIGNRIKASLRDSIVLPNCESIPMPWMLAEKDDWVPRNDAPFIWLNHEPTEIRSHATAIASAQSEEAVLKDDVSSKKSTQSLHNLSDGSEESRKSAASIDETKEEPVAEASDMQSLLAPAGESSHSDENEELRKPLLITEKLQEDAAESRVSSPLYTSLRAVIPAGEVPASPAGDDAKRKGGRRTRMLDFGKRVGDKLEEKRRTIEEKGRHIVEKMRENARTNSMERTTNSMERTSSS